MRLLFLNALYNNGMVHKALRHPGQFSVFKNLWNWCDLFCLFFRMRSMSSSMALRITDLPQEILVNVCKRLDIDDVLALEQVLVIHQTWHSQLGSEMLTPLKL
jgi:hypothetical protein